MSRLAVVIVLASLIAGCSGHTTLERLTDERRISADLLVQFIKAADAANQAVMANTDEASVGFAREADETASAVQHEADQLGRLLKDSGYSNELALLEEFRGRFGQYRTLDHDILSLAVENTNLKAQRLSFGPAQAAADALRDSLDAVTPAAAELWHVKALATTAVASAREIQALQAPHIAEAHDAAMTSLENRMASSEKAARAALKALAGLIQPASRSQLASATAALDRLMEINAQIVDLSRRNSNVRSLALSMNQKRTITAQCEDTLQTLRDALAMRDFGTR